ncbi:preprotein translocase, YajC subunit [gamma proteobacterium HTCC5015]|nr:preprotein translocase, YajC subunit [gamma proteobacterium HTCC5015]
MLVEDILNFVISPAHAEAAAPAGADGGLLQLLPIVVLFVVMYFLMIRPQQKRAKEHRQMVEALKKGDEVVTSGGILGKVTEVGDAFIELKVNDNSSLRLQRQAIQSVMPKGTIKDAKNDKAAQE